MSFRGSKRWVKMRKCFATDEEFFRWAKLAEKVEKIESYSEEETCNGYDLDWHRYKRDAALCDGLLQVGTTEGSKQRKWLGRAMAAMQNYNEEVEKNYADRW